MLLDARVFAAYGRPCAGAITAITVQTLDNGLSVHPIEPQLFRRNLDAALATGPEAIKIGMLGNVAITSQVADTIRDIAIPIVLDPIIRATSGLQLLDEEGVIFLQRELLRFCNIVTPNWDEASLLTGLDVSNIGTAAVAARQIFESSDVPVLVTGGHSKSDLVDILVDDAGLIELPSDRVAGDFRGTGCALSSAIATELADGNSLRRAALSAKEFLAASLANSTPPYITFSI